ncbi:hypothetical protein T07_5540 [Trichinella nelsoni]|uniref:Uncharacterized protein n=1 Tax=Trichinella nelsoni TaxID=6336 RepID=A0A0V0RJ21_9BILA|nr:hypothetical protein T07_5540 [Trichinella nelsoni]
MRHNKRKTVVTIQPFSISSRHKPVIALPLTKIRNISQTRPHAHIWTAQHRTEHNVKRELRSLACHGYFYTSVVNVQLLDGLFSLTPNMIARHGIFQLLDGKQNGFLIYSKKCKGVNGWTAASRSGKSLEIFVQMFLKKFWLRWGPTGQAVLLPSTPLQSYYLDIRLLSLESSLPDALNFS